MHAFFLSKICNFSQKYAIISQKICTGKCLKFSYTYKKNAITFSISYPQNNYFFVELLAKSLSPSVQKFGLVGDKITNQPLSKEEGAVSKNYRNYIIFKRKLFKLHFDFANN